MHKSSPFGKEIKVGRIIGSKEESVSEFRYALFFLMVTSLDAPEGCRCTRDGIESSSAECGTDL